MGTCLICGKELPRQHRKYCSNECYSASGRAWMQEPLPPRYCEVCGKRILGHADKYCSQACYTASGTRPRPKRKPRQLCIVCGAEIPTNNQRFCSSACFHKYRTGRPNLKNRRPRQINTCQFCGAEFEVGGRGGRHKTSIFCSPKCHLASQRKDTGGRAWARLRESVIERDGHCVICGKGERVLQAHHIEPKGYEDVSGFAGKETADDLVTVCPGCHQSLECMTKAGYRNNPDFDPRRLLEMVRIR